jgi:hypothetical protein
MCTISISLTYAPLDRPDEKRLLRACNKVDPDRLFTKETENPLVVSCKSYFKNVKCFDDMLIEIQNFQIYESAYIFTQNNIKHSKNILSLLYADFVLQFFSGNVPGWSINPDLQATEKQKNKSVHALVCAGGYASAVESIGNKIEALISGKTSSNLKGHFDLYKEAYQTGKTRTFIEGSTTETIMKNYMGNIKPLDDYFSYMVAVSMCRSIHWYWVDEDISFAWIHAPMFLTNNQVQEITDMVREEDFWDDKDCRDIIHLNNSKKNKTLYDTALDNILKELLKVSELAPKKQEELFKAYNSLKKYFPKESAEKSKIVQALRQCVLTKESVNPLTELLLEIIDEDKQEIDPGNFWDNLYTFNEAGWKGWNHLSSMVAHMKEMIVGKKMIAGSEELEFVGRKKLSFMEFHQMTRAFYRVDQKNHTLMALLFDKLCYAQVMDNHQLALTQDVSVECDKIVMMLPEYCLQSLEQYRSEVFEVISEQFAGTSSIK